MQSESSQKHACYGSAYVTPLWKMLSVVLATAVLAGRHPWAAEPRLLVFSKIAPGGFRHEVIPLAIAAILKMGKESGFTVDTTQDSRTFTHSNLANYQAVFFNHAYGDVFDSSQQAAFQAYIRKGGGFTGIHASSYVELDWPWYRSLVGAYFKEHSAIVPGTLTVENGTHPSTKGLPGKWTRTEEWYDFDANPRPEVRVLLTVDEGTYTGGKMGADHPIAWYHDFEGGRAWYSALGHTAESYTDPYFLLHLRGGIQYALGSANTASILPDAGGNGLRDRQRTRIPSTGSTIVVTPLFKAEDNQAIFRINGAALTLKPCNETRRWLVALPIKSN